MKRSIHTPSTFSPTGNSAAIRWPSSPTPQGLSTGQMQSIAAEFNLAETTFVLPPKDPAHTAHVRIFTPKAEMPFAGHPNVGTAFVLARAGRVRPRRRGDRLVFEEKAGLVPHGPHARRRRCRRHAAGRARAAQLGAEIAPEIVAEAWSGWQPEDIGRGASALHRLATATSSCSPR